jgi:hypothetical protein
MSGHPQYAVYGGGDGAPAVFFRGKLLLACRDDLVQARAAARVGCLHTKMSNNT